MYFPVDDTLFSIGAVALAEEAEELDTTSDASNWVLQYTQWEEDATPFLEPAPSA